MQKRRKIYKTMVEDTSTGNRNGRYSDMHYYSRYKKGKNPIVKKAKKAEVKAKAKKATARAKAKTKSKGGRKK